MKIDIFTLPCITSPNQENVPGLCFFCVFFWLFGEKSVPLQRFCNILIINGYFRFCDMCATSGANALIVS